MLTVKEAIEKRRSVRHYKSDDVPDIMITEILEAGRLSPSNANLQPWRFIVVKDKEKKGELSDICWHQKSIDEAPVAIAVFADRASYSREARDKRRDESAKAGISGSSRFSDPKFREYIKSHPLPLGQDTVSSIVANTFIAIENMLLMATGLGLSTCWIGGFTETGRINKLFDAPEDWLPVAVIPVGYSDGDIGPARPRRPLNEIARWV